MNNIVENINQILANWNPLDVPRSVAIEEYKGYIPLILQSIESRQQLITCLENILINQLEVDYDPTNKEHLKDLQRICTEIIQKYQITKATN